MPWFQVINRSDTSTSISVEDFRASVKFGYIIIIFKMHKTISEAKYNCNLFILLRKDDTNL